MTSITKEIKQREFSTQGAKASVNILFTANWLSNKINTILKPYNLSNEQFNVLRILRGKSPDKMCQKDILERMIAKQSNLTLIIKKLVGKQFIEVLKSDVDKRLYVIGITDAGLDVLKSLDALFVQMGSGINGLSETEAEQLSGLLDKFRKD